jgi:choline transport protein
MGIFVCFPPGLPVAVGTRNYTSVMLVGLFLIILAFLGVQWEEELSCSTG